MVSLYKNNNKIYSYFNITSSDNYVLKFTLEYSKYELIIKKIQEGYILQYLVVILIITILSVLFSLYSLNPLRQALILTEEFIKDILHDFNTPLSSLRLNASMLKKEIGDNNKILRIEQSVESVLRLQSNLKSYLLNETQEKEIFSLNNLLSQRIDLVSKLYPDINFSSNINNVNLNCNKDALTRIVDNLLTNAAKYNNKDGIVQLLYIEDKKVLQIKDSGKGIKNVTKIFNRFYKEHDRGIGIGLHIVKKLSDELGIAISISSKVGVGTTFSLSLSSLTLH